MAGLDENPIVELGRQPIAGAAPCGTDPSDDVDYIAVQAEISKLDRIELGEPDWYAAEQAGTNILRSKSKDVETAAALALALFKRYRYAGLAAAFSLLTELVNNFWDGLFPERPRRRKAQIESVADRFSEGGWFRENQPGPDDFDAIDACLNRVDVLKAALTAKMPDEPPDFGKFVRGLKELADRRPKAAEAAPTGGPVAGAAGGGGGAGFSAEPVADASGAMNAILAAATFLRKADPTDPLPYAIARISKWAKIALPTSEEAKFRIEPPEASLLDTLAHQFSNGIWENLLKNAEAAFRSNDPLWLDLQRYVCAAMKALGPTFENARQAVMNLTAGLANRLGGGLYELKFRNGNPLCSGETRMWVETEVAPPRGRGGGGASAADGKLSEAYDKARQLAASGSLADAIGELQKGLSGCVQRRDRFLWRLRMAQLCCDAQRLPLAASLVEECYEEVRRFHIDEWESSLAVEVAQALYRCRKSVVTADKQPTPEALQRVRESFAWLCQLDPLAALAAEPAGV